MLPTSWGDLERGSDWEIHRGQGFIGVEERVEEVGFVAGLLV
jgi:hypothetical protein